MRVGLRGFIQNWMRDYDPTTGRYIQADPLGLVDGASVYGYALQNPGRHVDPRGECVGPLAYACAGAVVGAITSVFTGYILDEDGCYEWDEALFDAFLGAALGAGGSWWAGAGRHGAGWAYKTGAGGWRKVPGKEWSHSIPRRATRNWNKWWYNQMNKRGGFNGSWTTPKRHYKHDPFRYPSGHRQWGRKFDPFRSAADRIPDWAKGAGVGGAAGAASSSYSD